MADDDKRPDETWPEWGARTGRFRPERMAFWDRQLRIEARALAARGTQVTAGLTPVQRTIRSLAVVLANDEPDAPGIWARSADGYPTPRVNPATAARNASETPLLDQLDEAMYGPSREERYRREDLAAEAALREELDAEAAEAAQQDLSPAEYAQLFGDEDEHPAG